MNKRHYEHTLPNIRGSLSNTYIVIVVKCNPDSTELERFERMPVVEPVGIHAAEHTAGVSMSGHYCHTAIAASFVFPACAPCGCIRRFTGFPSSESDDMQHPDHYAEQHQEHKFLTHIEPFYFCKVSKLSVLALKWNR